MHSTLLFTGNSRVNTVLKRTRPTLFLLGVDHVHTGVFVCKFNHPKDYTNVKTIFFCLRALASLVHRLSILRILILPHLGIVRLVTGHATSLMMVQSLTLETPSTRHTYNGARRVHHLVHHRMEKLQPFRLLLYLDRGRPPPYSGFFSQGGGDSHKGREEARTRDLICLNFRKDFIFIISPIARNLLSQTLNSCSQ